MYTNTEKYPDYSCNSLILCREHKHHKKFARLAGFDGLQTIFSDQKIFSANTFIFLYGKNFTNSMQRGAQMMDKHISINLHPPHI
jgi:rubrerythrin